MVSHVLSRRENLRLCIQPQIIRSQEPYVLRLKIALCHAYGWAMAPWATG